MVFHFWLTEKNNSSLQKKMNNQNKSVSLEIHMDLRITKKPEKSRQLNHNMHLSLICGDKRRSPTFNSHYFEGEGIFANRQTNLKDEILFKKKLFFCFMRSQTLEQNAQIICGVSILHVIQHTSAHVPGQCIQPDPALRRGHWTR